MSGVVTSRVVPPDHLPRLAGMRPWDGGWLGAFAAFGRDTSANVGRNVPGATSRPWRTAGYVCGPDLERSKALAVEGSSGRRL